jgi:iron(III) transport system permease protein
LRRLTRFRQIAEFWRIFQDPVLFIGLILVVIFVVVAILAPIYKMVEESQTAKGQGLFDRYLNSPVYRRIIENTLKMGLIVGATGTALGFLMAYVQVKMRVPFKRFMHIMCLIPVISPPFAVATSVLLLFGRSGLISKRMFGVRYDIYGLDGLTIVLTLSLFTLAYLNLKGMMLALDPALDEAATNLGASKWRIFRTVTLPMLLPGIAGSFLIIFVEAVADLGNPLVLGGNYEVLATRIYVSIVGLYNTTAAAVLSVILLVPSLVVFAVQRYWVSRLSVISVTGKPSGRPQEINHPLVRWPLFAFAIAVCLLIVLIYAVIFVGSLVNVFNVDNTFTLEHFDFVINGYGSEAMKDTTQLSAIATPVAGIVGMLIAFLVVRKKFLGRGALDFATMMGIAVPGTILGIGYLLMFNRPNDITLPLIGTVTLIPKLTGGRAVFGGAGAIVLVYIIRSTPAALRAGVASLSQIDPVIEEASISLGADTFATFRRITLPLIRPAFFSGLVYAFARSMTTISAIIFLTTPRTKIMTAQILNEVENARYGNAFAYCVILIGIVLVAIGILAVAVGTTTGTERTLEGGA